MYRIGVSALIINARNEFLLVNLLSFEEKYFAIPGGGVEAGEDLESAVYREIREELGISKESLELIGKSEESVRLLFKTGARLLDAKEYLGQERYFFGFRFIGSESEIAASSVEVRKYMWAKIGSLGEYLLFDNQLQETSEKIIEIFQSNRLV